MKVLYLLHDFLPEHVGGTEVHTHDLALEIASRGHEVAVACTERDLSRADGEVRERRVAGLRVLEAAHAREYSCAEETWEEPRQPAVFEELLATVRPDVLHVQHFAQWGTAVLEVAARAHVPAVVTLHDYHLLCATACLLRADGSLCAGDCGQCLHTLPPPRQPAASLETLAAARRAQHAAHLLLAQRVLAPSRFLASMMQARGLVPADRVQILDTGVVGPWREPRGSDPQRPLRIGYAGGIYPSKGVHVLIQAFTQLPPGTATLELHGVLEWFPSYVGHLKQLAGERADVRWHGRFAPDAIDAILAGLDLLVVPSLWYENRPLSIQAAFRCGVPVLSSDLGGLAELVEPGRGGERFPRGDVGALAQLLRELAADRPRLQALARARPRLPSMAEVAGRHLELYAAVANGNRLFPGGFLRYPDLP